jgi:predicted nucleic acid-binding protein
VHGRLHAPHLVDSEIASALRQRVRGAELTAGRGWHALDTRRRLALTRYAMHPLQIWQLLDNLSAYDASYVALAEALGCALVTADRRLAGGPAVRCAITVVPD